MERETVRLRCECGHDIRCVTRLSGSYLASLAFFDDRALSETHGEQIAFCPGCGVRPAVALLLGRLGEAPPPLLASRI